MLNEPHVMPTPWSGGRSRHKDTIGSKWAEERQETHPGFHNKNKRVAFSFSVPFSAVDDGDSRPSRGLRGETKGIEERRRRERNIQHSSRWWRASGV